MKWRRLALRIDGDDEPQAVALLESIGGARGWTVRERGRRAVVSVCVPASRARRLAAQVAARLHALTPAGVLRRATLSSAEVADEDWATSWRRRFAPQQIAPGWWVVPPWEDASRLPRGARALRIDPGMAFGTGQHPTTRLALQLSLPRVKPGEAMLDIGCGSGIIGIAAAMRGALVHASDMDPIATKAARANLRRNGVTAVAVRTARGVPAAFPSAALISANITADVLAALAPRLAEKLSRGGALVTSGVAGGRRDTMLRAFELAGLSIADERRAGEWYAFVHVR